MSIPIENLSAGRIYKGFCDRRRTIESSRKFDRQIIGGSFVRSSYLIYHVNNNQILEEGAVEEEEAEEESREL